MEILYLLIPLSVVLVFVIAVVFWMSVRGGSLMISKGRASRCSWMTTGPGRRPRHPAWKRKKTFCLIWVKPGGPPPGMIRSTLPQVHYLLCNRFDCFSVGVGVRYGAPFFCVRGKTAAGWAGAQQGPSIRASVRFWG